MTLEPNIAELVNTFIREGRPSVKNQTFAERREGYIASTVLAGDVPPGVHCEEINWQSLTLRLYTPPNAQPHAAAVIYYHGGCFVSGGFATHDCQLQNIAFHSGCKVIAVQYRLAPEHRYPAAHDDAYHAAEMIHDRAEMLDIDPNRIILMGDSAGGHLALVTAIRLRDRGAFQPCGQILIYPMLDATASSDSCRTNGTDYVITRETLMSGYEAYFASLPASHCEASPAMHNPLAGLPSTLILTGEYDPLRDEGEALFRALTEQGVHTQCRRYLGVIHGFFQLGGISQAANDAMQDVTTAIKKMGKFR
ncbi:alpha/beta hydrolase [Pectobacterium versatile]|uniref:alpha/beta hydrolase n=1 Tax=Pectobacterium versatile TaxID=2488639 RepID=UPI00102EEC87|nr:alpha/beta hydrolase [Pectobacterium versatile]GKX38881.1 lipase [Pectobacterium carotovorum subsp. carotovorum]MBN3196239.1 alpha/beta hydrolase [Pectobacterium versatile]MBQ4775826.1 alpha/beta hydrolase fold domain-containing protein [Pectobacterium versatile]TAI98231.1 alpha/beta hydrolase [Pectobacterium versatile]GLX45254.1 lipase [Pectobacterium carotovorum subsp. carotovorum]